MTWRKVLTRFPKEILQSQEGGATLKRMLYAIGDIHGCARELDSLLQQIAPKPDDTVVFLGDYIDRGPDSKGVIDLILELKKKTQVVALKGNHEQLFLDFLESPQSPGAGMFILNGGTATLASYAGPGSSFELPEEHLNFFYSLQTSHQTATHFFVHAGVPDKPLRELTEADDMHLMWMRQPFLSSVYQWSKIVVHGHTPCDAPEILANRINLDTGCVYNGFLTAIELPTGRLIQVQRESPFMTQPYEKAGAPEAEEGRIAVRFTGRLPVTIAHSPHPLEFETLNYNQFGLLMREIVALGESASLTKGEKISGTIGREGPAAIEFEGTVARVESKNSVRLYGVSLTRVSNDSDGREWIERPVSRKFKSSNGN